MFCSQFNTNLALIPSNFLVRLFVGKAGITKITSEFLHKGFLILGAEILFPADLICFRLYVILVDP